MHLKQVDKATIRSSKSTFNECRCNYKQAKINVGDTRIKELSDGIINKRFIEPGSMLYAMPATQLFEIVNVNTLKLTVNVNESQVASLKQELL
jgi:multidrug resistance efflux pump